MNRCISGAQDQLDVIDGNQPQHKEIIACFINKVSARRSAALHGAKVADIIIAKNAHGICRDYRVAFDAECMLFSEENTGTVNTERGNGRND